jgi:adenylylsulfate kinase-like enzyme
MEREEKRKAKFSPRDIYKKASATNAAVPGVNVAYEEPQSPEIEVDAARMSLEESANRIADRVSDIFGLN